MDVSRSRPSLESGLCDSLSTWLVYSLESMLMMLLFCNSVP